MGTRGFYGFRHRGRVYVFFNYADSHPWERGLGVRITTEVRSWTSADILRCKARLESWPRDLASADGSPRFVSLEEALNTPSRFSLVAVDAFPWPMRAGDAQFAYMIDFDTHTLRYYDASGTRLQFPLDAVPPNWSAYLADEEGPEN
jgi:hypothetical protein